jgi:hypothetical protein
MEVLNAIFDLAALLIAFENAKQELLFVAHPRLIK